MSRAAFIAFTYVKTTRYEELALIRIEDKVCDFDARARIMFFLASEGQKRFEETSLGTRDQIKKPSLVKPQSKSVPERPVAKAGSIYDA